MRIPGCMHFYPCVASSCLNLRIAGNCGAAALDEVEVAGKGEKSGISPFIDLVALVETGGSRV